MKRETVEEKFNRMLGLAPEKVQEVKTRTTGKVVGVTEEEIQEFREAQGLLYFFQAPELFSYKVCKHCGEGFFVSRKYVGFCSYTCIRRELEKDGIKWRKGDDIEALVKSEVYEGNEPVWIRQRIIKKLMEMVSSPPTEKDYLDSVERNEPAVGSELPMPRVSSKSDVLKQLGLAPTQESSSNTTEPSTSTTSSASTMNNSSMSGGGPSSKTKKPSRRVILSD